MSYLKPSLLFCQVLAIMGGFCFVLTVLAWLEKIIFKGGKK